MKARIEPLTEPYEPETAKLLESMMPAGLLDGRGVGAFVPSSWLPKRLWSWRLRRLVVTVPGWASEAARVAASCNAIFTMLGAG